MRIGLISDTHLPSLMRSLDELGPQIREFLSGVDLVLHGGDVTSPSVLDWCAQFGDLVVAQGNNDAFDDPRMAPMQFVDIEGWRIGMVHELRPESRPIPVLLEQHLGGEQVDILIGGDTHVERLDYRDGVVFVNSGSPNLPHHKETRLGTVAVLELSRDRCWGEIITLGETPGRRNPGVARHIEVVDGVLASASLAGKPLLPEEPAHGLD